MQIIDGKTYREFRCAHCHVLICYEYIFAGRIAVDKCPKCGHETVGTFKHIRTQDNDAIIKDEFMV